jgi:hypothetical protein
MIRYVFCGLILFAPALILCQQCPQDLNNNGVIDHGDLLELLSLYGEICDVTMAFTPIISEIHYNPSFEQGLDSEWEFIEIYNPHSITINISGWAIADAVEVVFVDGLFIDPGRYIVIASDIGSYEGELPYDTQLFEFNEGFEINNNGATIRLLNSDGMEIDIVEFTDYNEWPSEADGAGPSLEWRGMGFDNSLPNSWIPSNSFGGSPGAPNSSWSD